MTGVDLQKGDGISVEIVGTGNDELWLAVDEDELIKMIRIAFDCPEFSINHLIDALRAACCKPSTEPDRRGRK